MKKLTAKEQKEIQECLEIILASGGTRSEDIEQVQAISLIVLGHAPTYNEKEDEWSFKV